MFAPQTYIVVLRAHPVRGESHIQRNASGELATVLFMISRLRSLNNVDSFTFHELHSYVYYHRLQHLPQLVSDFFIDFSHPKSVAKIGHNLASTWPQSIVAFEVWTASKTMTQKEKSCIQSKVAN